MNKIIKKTICMGMALSLTACLIFPTACDGGKNDVSQLPHEHTYAATWSYDETYHWKAANCEHKELFKDKAAHIFDDGNTCSVCHYTQKPADEDPSTDPGKDPSTDPDQKDFLGSEWIVPHAEGASATYVFEAECTNLGNKDGEGWSGGQSGDAMVVSSGTASHGAAVSYLYLYGASVNFLVVSDRDVEDATLVLVLDAERFDLELDSENYGIRVDPVSEFDLLPAAEGGAWGAWDENFLNFYDDDNPDGAPFEGYWINRWTCETISIDATGRNFGQFDEFVITAHLRLKKGVNSISLITLNNDSPGGTMRAKAPVVDCIKISTTAQLGMYMPVDNRGYGNDGVRIEE